LEAGVIKAFAEIADFGHPKFFEFLALFFKKVLSRGAGAAPPQHPFLISERKKP
jgi:hypothetical protein